AGTELMSAIVSTLPCYDESTMTRLSREHLTQRLAWSVARPERSRQFIELGLRLAGVGMACEMKRTAAMGRPPGVSHSAVQLIRSGRAALSQAMGRFIHHQPDQSSFDLDALLCRRCGIDLMRRGDV